MFVALTSSKLVKENEPEDNPKDYRVRSELAINYTRLSLSLNAN